MKTKKLASDVIWSVAAMMVLNGTLQLLIYPSLNRSLGSDAFGDVLYVMSILAIIAPSIGGAANNTRLIERQYNTVNNGDCLLAMLSQLLPGSVVLLAVVSHYVPSPWHCLLLVMLLAATTLRYYGDVEYRLELRYTGYFKYYAIISLGYLLGVLTYPLFHSWILVFFLGEAVGFIYVFLTGKIYKPLRLSPTWKKFARRDCILAGAYLLSNAVLNLDRVLLQNLIGSTYVTIYYVASLLGKTIALFVAPLNGVIIGYMTKNNIKMTQKSFAAVLAFVATGSVLLYGAISLFVPWFARTFYPDIAVKVIEFAPIANLSQILCFVTSLLLTIMLTFGSEKNQFAIQSGYAVLFVSLCILGTRWNAIHGFLLGGLIASGVRLAAVVLVGLYLARKAEKRSSTAHNEN